MRPSTIEHAGETLSAAGAGALAIAALADLGATYAGWPPIAARPGLAPAVLAAAAMVAAGAVGAISRARPTVAAGAVEALRTSRSVREAVLAVALVAVALAFAAGLALDARPRRVWALAAVAMVIAWAFLVSTVSARPGSVPATRLLAGHAAGAVLVEAVVRPASGPTWVAAAGTGLLVAALVADAGRFLSRGGDEASARRWPRAVASAAAFAVPAVWLVAGLGDRAAGFVAAIACVGGLAALRTIDEAPGGGGARNG